MRRKHIILIIVVGIVCLGVFLWMGSWEDNSVDFENSVELALVSENGEEIMIDVELAENVAEKAEGLSERESLGENIGMLFVYEENVLHGFWMEDTYIPLSIAFISSDGKIIDIQDMEPRSIEYHKPEIPYRYALEVNQGFFNKYGISENDKILIPSKV